MSGPGSAAVNFRSLEDFGSLYGLADRGKIPAFGVYDGMKERRRGIRGATVGGIGFPFSSRGVHGTIGRTPAARRSARPVGTTARLRAGGGFRGGVGAGGLRVRRRLGRARVAGGAGGC